MDPMVPMNSEGLVWQIGSPGVSIRSFQIIRTSSRTPHMLIAQLLHATLLDTYYQLGKSDVIDKTPPDKSTREIRQKGIVGLWFAAVHRNPQKTRPGAVKSTGFGLFLETIGSLDPIPSCR
ncbi:iron-sulfur assembly protein [Musa troglodytarum]|uniref:Iron-sulfur assembly protein n=1 Tax=Musa troglodytarum TaxID=320322 RepID=A0A9E7HYY1_9LILI|nr:iron-sulfur assembly protein [Musa troglodytarum]